MSTAVNHDIRGQSLARGVIRGSVPVKGRFMDGESVMEIDLEPDFNAAAYV